MKLEGFEIINDRGIILDNYTSDTGKVMQNKIPLLNIFIQIPNKINSVSHFLIYQFLKTILKVLDKMPIINPCSSKKGIFDIFQILCTYLYL